MVNQDDCDSLGADIKKNRLIGDLATLILSWLTTLQWVKGAVLINNRRLKMPALSFRDWEETAIVRQHADNTGKKRYS